jgi:23S rRNA pseudouridine1911/1915/1917 synthase
VKRTVKTACTLFDFLKTIYHDSPNRTIKQIIENNRVVLNGRVARLPKLPLKPGYVVEILRKELHPLNPALTLVHEDDDIIVIDKSEGLLTIATEREQEKNVYSYLYEYVKGKGPKNRLFIVHRLDEGTSGLIVFARNQDVQEQLRQAFATHDVERRYVALVEGTMKKKEGTLRCYLAEGKNFKVYPTDNKEKGKLAITHYKVMRQTDTRALLDINLETGRRGQIRVQLSNIGCPIVGDKKYGAATDPFKRLCLHAYKLSLVHPVTNKKIVFQSTPPKCFSA